MANITDVSESIIEHCDKCECVVVTKNCSITMSAIAWDEPYTGLFCNRRCITCSPSRAQHIVHPDFEPVVDDRAEFDKRLFDEKKRTEFEKRWTAAWLMCQHEEIAAAWMSRLEALWIPVEDR